MRRPEPAPEPAPAPGFSGGAAGIVLLVAIVALAQSWQRWLDPIIDTGRDLYIPEQLPEILLMLFSAHSQPRLRHQVPERQRHRQPFLFSQPMRFHLALGISMLTFADRPAKVGRALLVLDLPICILDAAGTIRLSAAR